VAAAAVLPTRDGTADDVNPSMDPAPVSPEPTADDLMMALTVSPGGVQALMDGLASPKVAAEKDAKADAPTPPPDDDDADASAAPGASMPAAVSLPPLGLVRRDQRSQCQSKRARDAESPEADTLAVEATEVESVGAAAGGAAMSAPPAADAGSGQIAAGSGGLALAEVGVLVAKGSAAGVGGRGKARGREQGRGKERKRSKGRAAAVDEDAEKAMRAAPKEAAETEAAAGAAAMTEAATRATSKEPASGRAGGGAGTPGPVAAPVAAPASAAVAKVAAAKVAAAEEVAPKEEGARSSTSGAVVSAEELAAGAAAAAPADPAGSPAVPSVADAVPTVADAVPTVADEERRLRFRFHVNSIVDLQEALRLVGDEDAASPAGLDSMTHLAPPYRVSIVQRAFAASAPQTKHWLAAYDGVSGEAEGFVLWRVDKRRNKLTVTVEIMCVRGAAGGDGESSERSIEVGTAMLDRLLSLLPHPWERAPSCGCVSVTQFNSHHQGVMGWWRSLGMSHSGGVLGKTFLASAWDHFGA